MPQSYDILITGAGPSGSLAAAHLVKAGYKVLILEKESFPRFSIGESMLPQIMGLLEDGGLLRGVVECGFQYKNGAAFVRGGRRTEFDFRQKSSKGWSTTYQVQRGIFDKALADQAEAMGAEIRYRNEIQAVDVSGEKPRLTVKGEDGKVYEVEGRFLLDASGFARLLPRLLKLERPSSFPSRRAVFTHVKDNIPHEADFDRNKIRVTVHPEHVDIWYWLIPFSNGRSSVGVVAEQKYFDGGPKDLMETVRHWHAQDPELSSLLKNAVWDTPAREIVGYSADVTSLYGNHFALLGNAGEFLDPVFSSGVTIAFKSAAMAAPLVDRELKGGKVDWEAEYAKPLKKGVDAFRAFVESWYRGGFQDIILFEKQEPQIRRYICSILAGYAWDESNPYVAEPRRVAVLEELCKRPS